MITLLYGPDSYRRDAKKKSLTKELVARGMRDVRAFDVAQESSLPVFREFINSSPLFSQNKQIATIVMDTVKNDDWALALKKVLPYADVEIIITADEKPKGAYSFLLKKPAVSESFEYAKGSDWKSFIEAEAEGYNVSLAPETLRALTYEYEKNTWGLITELKKLRNAGNRIIYPNDLLLARDAQSDFWSTMNQFRSHERRVRLKTLEEVLARDDPAKIFYILGAQLKGRETAMAHADLAIKSGKVDYEEALLGLLL